MWWTSQCVHEFTIWTLYKNQSHTIAASRAMTVRGNGCSAVRERSGNSNFFSVTVFL